MKVDLAFSESDTSQCALLNDALKTSRLDSHANTRSQEFRLRLSS